MSKYTTEVRYICESFSGLDKSVDGDVVDEVISESADKIFGNFPIFDENYRLVLESKILKHYYTREIGFETAGLWQLKLNTKMNEIMPYYNKLYESELLEFNPFYDTDMRKEATSNNIKDTDMTNTLDGSFTYDKNTAKTGNDSDIKTGVDIQAKGGKDTLQNEGSDMSDSENTRTLNTTTTNDNTRTNNLTDTENGTHWDYFSDTPQGSVSRIDVDDNNYLTTADKKTDNVTDTHVGTIDDYGQSRDSGTITDETQNTATYSSTQSNIYDSDVTTSYNTSVTKEYNSGVAESGVDTTNNTTKDKGTIKDDYAYFDHVFGKSGSESYSKLLKEFRETFINIDLMIINELSDLFLNLW